MSYQQELFEPPSGDKPATPKDFSERQNPGLLEMSGFLKKSLKKIKESPDLKNEKTEIYKKMVRAHLWTDEELLELARTMTAEELEALYEKRRAG